MQRDLLRPLAIALLCVVAIAVASATLTDPVSTAGHTRDVGTPGSDLSESWESPQLDRSDGIEEGNGPDSSLTLLGLLCFPFLKTLGGKLLILLLLGLVSYELYRKMGAIGVSVGLLAMLPSGFILYALLTVCQPQVALPPLLARWGYLRPAQHGELWGATNNSSTGAGSGGGAAADPPFAFLLVAGVLAVLLVAAFVRSTGDDAEDDESEPEPEPSEPDLAAVGSVAGEAADRIEGAADVENEVYRAWREMTTLLEVDGPQTSTPAEFQAAALAAGMDRGEVATLTEVFREVRYGGAEPTADREERAVGALRAIEAAHAEGAG